MTTAVNIHETNGRSVTEALPDTTLGLRRLRRKYGYNSAIGHRCSNISEMMRQLPPGPQHRIEYLTQDGVKYQRNRLLENIQRQSDELAELLAAQAPAIQGAQIR